MESEIIILVGGFDCYAANCPLRDNTTSSCTFCTSAQNCHLRVTEPQTAHSNSACDIFTSTERTAD